MLGSEVLVSTSTSLVTSVFVELSDGVTVSVVFPTFDQGCVLFLGLFSAGLEVDDEDVGEMLYLCALEDTAVIVPFSSNMVPLVCTQCTSLGKITYLYIYMYII